MLSNFNKMCNAVRGHYSEKPKIDHDFKIARSVNKNTELHDCNLGSSDSEVWALNQCTALNF
jgi:hypothetical protein